MKQRKLLGTFTVLIAVPSLILLFVYILSGRGIFHAEAPEHLLRLITGLVGGVLLWKGKRTGYYLSAIAWGHLFVSNIYLFVSLLISQENFIFSFEPGWDYQTFTKPFFTFLGRSLIGLFCCLLLVKDLFFPHLQIKNIFENSIENGSWDGGRQ